jgi:hypothetical protein
LAVLELAEIEALDDLDFDLLADAAQSLLELKHPDSQLR